MNFSWTGRDHLYIDEPAVFSIGPEAAGIFGGSSKAGQYKNEDGCLIYIGEDWELGMILDAHKSAESAELAVREFSKAEQDVRAILTMPTGTALKELPLFLADFFTHPDFLAACREVEGETACLIAVRKDKYLFWFSIGDCVLHLYHPELAALGEYQQNHRSFYEWVGQVNTFELPVPCISTGVKELRKGSNHIFLATDGLLECPELPYNKPEAFSESFKTGQLKTE
ncbi:protein phosphatase 2C domain-containing protein [Metabacillus sp. 84]|uniref:protein phosphatase 2C domain-containing protein n=1 Tax=Metabacillus sp. 84 TaxID=3404705 RepID=UPI003CEFE629